MEMTKPSTQLNRRMALPYRMSRIITVFRCDEFTATPSNYFLRLRQTSGDFLHQLRVTKSRRPPDLPLIPPPAQPAPAKRKAPKGRLLKLDDPVRPRNRKREP